MCSWWGRVALVVVVFSASVGSAAGGSASPPQADRLAAGVIRRPASGTLAWWNNAVIYEIYPRSFQDSNGDGVGDLRGIITRLDYLKDLGVDAIWLTPVYPSPQVDFGYDVADYTTIDPQYGTMKDFESLVAEAKARGIRVIMDMVLNHTSDKHPWFVESSSSKTNPRRDWYVWNSGRPGPNGTRLPPNNWQSLFGHSAWQPSQPTGELYYHMFYAAQPDLNWRNPQVKRAMFEAVGFWLDHGAAGYRLDALDTLFEVTDLRNAKEGPGLNVYGDPAPDFSLQSKQPEVHDVLRELRTFADGFKEAKLLIGEMYTRDAKELAGWYGATNNELHLPMDTHLITIQELDAGKFREALQASQTDLGGNMPLLVTDNHDQPRSWDRYGDGTNNVAIARALAALLLGTRSTALVYYGQELGMVTTPPTRKEDVRDPIGITGWPNEKGRDGERTPMQWDATQNAGFSKGTSWLPVPPTASTVNVAAQKADSGSLLNWYKRLLKLKRSHPAFHDGATTFANRDSDGVVLWKRVKGGTTVVAAVNCTAKPVTVSLLADIAPGQGAKLKTLLASAEGSTKAAPSGIDLEPYGVYIGEIKR